MKIYVDYYIRDDKSTHIMHTILTDADIVEILTEKFRNGDLGCPIYYDRTTVSVEFDLAEIRI